MTAPSNANTSGLEAEKRLKAIAAAVEFGPGNGIHFREEGAVTLAADIREVFVTAASAQARIDAAEARADRLAKALEDIENVADSFCDDSADLLAGQIRIRTRAALQQETQP
ncbi:hypothetical protein HNP47_000803 [Brevundimonas vesicularis]|uniref:Uncharacterized protein n=1 Tax=Brevundimonas vesicularis TaxID=41276 RepID=A0A7W9L4Z4_BREVE|nr:hypothetical protein [Brevundimonas vesicularis]MBB5770834.1 hypothetical protein [Brevundimonas vesicularis]